MTTTRKSIARTLDRAALRSEDSASEKQVWFLAGLMLEAGDDASDIQIDTGYALSSRQASSLIQMYLDRKAPKAPVPGPSPVAAAAPTPAPTGPSKSSLVAAAYPAEYAAAQAQPSAKLRSRAEYALYQRYNVEHVTA